MASISITLPDHIKKHIERQIAEGRFDDEAAAIVAAVEQTMESPHRWEEDEDLLEAIAQADRGEVKPWTAELRDQILREAREGAERGDPVPYDLTY